MVKITISKVKRQMTNWGEIYLQFIMQVVHFPNR